MSNTKESFTDTIVNYLRDIAAVIGLFGGISYIAGYLISNFYVGKYGVSTFNLVQSRYFATGAFFLILTMAIISPPIIGFVIINISSEKKSRNIQIRNTILITLSFLLSAIIIWYSGNIITRLNSNADFVTSAKERRITTWSGLTVTGMALLTPIILAFIVRWISSRSLKDKNQQNSKLIAFLLSSVFIFFFLIGLRLFSEYVYPNASPVLGGNAPTRVQLVLSEYLLTIKDFPVKNNGGITESIILIDQTTSSILILEPNSNKVIEIPSSEIKSILR